MLDPPATLATCWQFFELQIINKNASITSWRSVLKCNGAGRRCGCERRTVPREETGRVDWPEDGSAVNFHCELFIITVVRSACRQERHYVFGPFGQTVKSLLNITAPILNADVVLARIRRQPTPRSR